MDKKKISSAFDDDRGSIFDLLTDEDIHHIGYLITKKNSIRGKHYHKEQKQFTLVLEGRAKIITKDLLDENSEIEETILDEMEMVLFPAFCYHSIEAQEDSKILVFTSKSRTMESYEDDTIRVEDITTYKKPN